MNLRRVGESGLEVSAVGLGCNNLGGRIDDETSKQVLHEALDLGITCFDTADTYGIDGGSEQVLGRLLGGRRKDVVIATKFGQDMHRRHALKSTSRQHILAAVEASLRRLRTDYIDLYQQHLPDPRTPIEETLRALDDLVRQGKVRYVGCSNLSAWQVVDAQWTARHLGLHRFVSCQEEYSLLRRGVEKELLPAMGRFGMGLLPYFPLASGLLTGKYDDARTGDPAAGRLFREKDLQARYMTPSNLAKVKALGRFAAERGHSLLELALSWLNSRPGVASVIAGATSARQVRDNVGLASWQLSAAELGEIDRISLARDGEPIE